MCLQKGSVCCICSKASWQPSVKDFGVGLLFWETCGCGITGGVEAESDVLCMWLLVWKAGPSFTEAVNMLMEFPVGETNLERQSAALFLAPEIHSKVIL